MDLIKTFAQHDFPVASSWEMDPKLQQKRAWWRPKQGYSCLKDAQTGLVLHAQQNILWYSCPVVERTRIKKGEIDIQTTDFVQDFVDVAAIGSAVRAPHVVAASWRRPELTILWLSALLYAQPGGPSSADFRKLTVISNKAKSHYSPSNPKEACSLLIAEFEKTWPLLIDRATSYNA